ncbi:S53 family peptidase [Alicyclobacillus sp.]|uniref:S53 family peptidase n=1 Tax=Alicyclobacillus sp. TaxID=61169 RepID=UPI0025BC95CA|nr:S53 family peptidase [Alicyclobacillus sp.]MCL6517692.1 S53 family peptidase [Alicyclobacillus sp.]
MLWTPTFTGMWLENHLVINVSGTVAQLESVFGTQIHQFRDDQGNTFFANVTDDHVSGPLANFLVGTTGMDQLAAPKPNLVRSGTQSGETVTLSSSRKSGSTSDFYDGSSQQIQQAYDYLPVYAQGIDGSGQTIAIVDAYGSPTIQQDLETFRETVEQGAYGADKPLQLEVVTAPGTNVMAQKNPAQAANASGWAGETSMDVELAHAVAPGAKILLVQTPNNYNDLYMGVNYVVDNALANQISLSWGSVDTLLPAAERRAQSQIFAQAAAEGINVFVSSGDSGDLAAIMGSPYTEYPASDPNVVAVGGTSLFVNRDGSYKSEIEWGETVSQIRHPDGTVVQGPIFWFGAGGGVSHSFAKPSWQTGAGLDSTQTMRQVPDVGYDADPYTGFTLVMNGEIQPGWGGTSDAAPQWAAICALANQLHVKNFGTPLPYINPILYANGQRAFHDVVHGTRDIVLEGSVTHNLYYVTMGEDTSLVAAPGWDDTTGLGTPDVARVVQMLGNTQ